MQYEIEIRSLATIETLEAYDWCEQQQEGLGLKFLNELEKFYSILLQNPNTHSYYQRPVRQGKINRFPYTVIYEVFKTRIVIYSVFMGKQNPIKKRIT